jgi:hypothetical protein
MSQNLSTISRKPYSRWCKHTCPQCDRDLAYTGIITASFINVGQNKLIECSEMKRIANFIVSIEHV